MLVPFSNLRAQNESIRTELCQVFSDAITDSAFILGKPVQDFEQRFAEMSGAEHCVAVNSGTSALHLALHAYGIGHGDEVITVPLTFAATTEAIRMCGATPVFIDVDSTLTMDAAQLEKAITKRTKAIIPVHLYGRPVAAIPEIMKIARVHDLRVIWDACQAHLAEYRSTPVGSFGDAVCYSFYPGKNLGALGEGGAVLTNNKDIANYTRLLRNHGQEEKYKHQVSGFNYRMDSLQGAALGIKLNHLKWWTAARQKCVAWYNRNLGGNSIDGHVYHIYAVACENRTYIMEALAAQGIQTGIHYPIPLHRVSYQYTPKQFPVSEWAAEHTLSLPLFPEMTREQVDYVCAALKPYKVVPIQA